MRSYIFTPLERQIIRDWLEGSITLRDIRVRKIKSRLKLFKDLSRDVDLYLRSREAATTSAELLREAATTSSA